MPLNWAAPDHIADADSYARHRAIEKGEAPGTGRRRSTYRTRGLSQR
ncbi:MULTISPECIES: hypothetical protein [Streptomyces]|nr:MULTISPECIES: hypothetical protein [Streptomyces]UFQ19881.1 hypothetical protein J2N69_35715 [Streptomyces huasconensis]WCL89504.1 hypothetical protein PPN52_35660 [Streptomyces sp. JCM 35825]